MRPCLGNMKDTESGGHDAPDPVLLTVVLVARAQVAHLAVAS